MSLVWEFSVISQEQSWEAYFLTRTDFLPVPTAPWISRFWACSLWFWWVNLQCNSLIALVIVLTPWIRRTLLSTLNCQVGCNSHIFLQELTSLHWYQQLQRLESLNPTAFHLKKKIHMPGTSLLLMPYEKKLRQGAVPSQCFVFWLFAEQCFDRVYKTLHSWS